MVPFGDDRQRVDDWRDEKPGLSYQLPHLVQVSITKKQDAAGQGEANHDQHVLYEIPHKQRDGRGAWRAMRHRQKSDDEQTEYRRA